MARVNDISDLGRMQQMIRTSGCYALYDAARAVTRFYDQVLEPTGLCVTEMGILRVCAHRGPISVAGLARELATNRATILRSVKPLVAKCMLIDFQSARRRRARLIELTETGRKSLVEAVTRWDRAQQHLMARLGETRWKQLSSELSAIIAIGPAAGADDPPAQVPQSRG